MEEIERYSFSNLRIKLLLPEDLSRLDVRDLQIELHAFSFLINFHLPFISRFIELQ